MGCSHFIKLRLQIIIFVRYLYAFICAIKEFKYAENVLILILGYNVILRAHTKTDCLGRHVGIMMRELCLAFFNL